MPDNVSAAIGGDGGRSIDRTIVDDDRNDLDIVDTGRNAQKDVANSSRLIFGWNDHRYGFGGCHLMSTHESFQSSVARLVSSRISAERLRPRFLQAYDTGPNLQLIPTGGQ